MMPAISSKVAAPEISGRDSVVFAAFAAAVWIARPGQATLTSPTFSQPATAGNLRDHENRHDQHIRREGDQRASRWLSRSASLISAAALAAGRVSIASLGFHTCDNATTAAAPTKDARMSESGTEM